MKRKEFIRKSAGLIAGGLFLPSWVHRLMAATPAVGGNPIFNRTLVILNLNGGNDGLNTVIPYTDSIYFDSRPNIRIPENQVLPLNDILGLHPAMTGIHQLWQSGKMAVISNVGYPQQNLSHFRSTDIWSSASDADQYLNTGWLARYFEAVHPDIPDVMPDNPLALQQASSNDLLLRGDRGMTGMIVDDPSIFSYLVNQTYTGEFDNEPPDTAGGDELSFIRQIDAASYHYAQVIQDAADHGENVVPYPESDLGFQLSTVAKLLSGGMKSPVFLTNKYGFDTHADQPGAHANLWQDVSQCIHAFFTDLKGQDLDRNVILMTTSEFGRRPFENGSLGTDHGAAAPHFLFGTAINQGIYGNPPDFTVVDENENLVPEFDYRQIYSTILQKWFSAGRAVTENVLMGDFQPLPLINPYVDDPVKDPDSISKSGINGELPEEFALLPPYPNPFNGSSNIRFTIGETGFTRITVYDVLGRVVEEPVKKTLSQGYYHIRLDANNWASGAYVVVMKSGGKSFTQKIKLVK